MIYAYHPFCYYFRVQRLKMYSLNLANYHSFENMGLVEKKLNELKSSSLDVLEIPSWVVWCRFCPQYQESQDSFVFFIV